MSILALTLPSIGSPNSTEDVDIINAFSAIQSDYNGNVDDSNLATAVKQKIGLSDGSIVRRGKSSIATSESTTATSYAIGNLTTPDRVQNVNLQTDGLIAVAYQAIWDNTVASAARAAIFVGATQLKMAQVNGAPVVQEATGANGTIFAALSTG